MLQLEVSAFAHICPGGRYLTQQPQFQEVSMSACHVAFSSLQDPAVHAASCLQLLIMLSHFCISLDLTALNENGL